MKKKNILVIGGGGREHAIIWKLLSSPKVEKIYALPGNAGISQIAECHEEIKATDIDSILDFVKNHDDIYLTVVAPDDPLAMGLVDKLQAMDKLAFGPTAAAAQIESSKAFSKQLMKKYNIPTAAFDVFEDFDLASEYIEKIKYPIVIKADGLALGKGVIICGNKEEAYNALSRLMYEKTFGFSGERVVIEEFLKGKEVSVLVFCDGKNVSVMPASKDHKRAFDYDEGLNTGGMGTISPVPYFDDNLKLKVYDTIILPTVRAMEKEGIPFKGVLYFGLMLTEEGPKVLEYNARFGDPEAQVILPLLQSDLLDIMEAVINGNLDKTDVKWNKGSCVCIVAASGGYPEAYEKNKPVTVGNLDDNINIFYAGVALNNGSLVTSGGRVLGVTALDNTLENARKSAYSNIKKISFDKMFYRNDIGKL